MSKGPILFFPSLAKTANTYLSGKLNVSLVYVEKKTQHCRNKVSKPTLQLVGIIPKLLSPSGGAINAFVWKLGTLTPLLCAVMMEAFS